MACPPISRRAALALLAGAPLATRLAAQARPPQIRRVIPGNDHTLLLEPDGTLKCWSTGPTPNTSGHLGQGHFNALEPYRLYTVPGLSNVVSAAAGLDTSFAVLADGRILSWGAKGNAGILGITPLAEVEVSAEARANTATPTPVAVRFDAVDLSLGANHALALARDGSVWTWGDGGQGRLGIGPLPVINFKTHRPDAMSFLPFPVRIPGLTDVVAVSAGLDHSLALLRDGTIRAWGANKFGQIGDGTTVDRRTPVTVQTGKAVAIAAARGSSFVVLADGTVLSWGENVSGMLGRLINDDADAVIPHPAPTVVPGVAGARAVYAGNGHMLVLTNAGTVISWGFDGHGQTGQGVTAAGTIARPPKTINGLTGVRSVATHGWTSVAVLNDGRIMYWGDIRPWITLRGVPRSLSTSPVLLNVDGLNNP